MRTVRFDFQSGLFSFPYLLNFFSRKDLLRFGALITDVGTDIDVIVQFLFLHLDILFINLLHYIIFYYRLSLSFWLTVSTSKLNSRIFKTHQLPSVYHRV